MAKAKTKATKKTAKAVKAKAIVKAAIKAKAKANAKGAAKATKVKAKIATKAKIGAKAKQIAKTKLVRTLRAVAKTKTATSVKPKAATKKSSTAAYAFPFLGSGAMPYDEVARVVIWFRSQTDIQIRADVLGELPPQFGAFGPDGIHALILETTEDLLTVLEQREARARFDRAIGEALVRLHAKHSIVFASRVALTDDEDEDTQAFAPDAWHAWSVKQAARILDVIEADSDVPAAIIATALGGHLDKKSEARARTHLLARLAPLVSAGDVTSEDVELFAALLVDASPAERMQLVTPVAPRLRISLANQHSTLFRDFVNAPDAMAVIEHLADTKTDDAWTDDSAATELARTNAHRVRWLIDRLTALAITDEKRKERALELAEAGINVANELSPQGEAWTASRMLTVKSLQTELDAALTYLDAATGDKDGGPQAVGTALAEAIQHRHRPLVDACIALALRDPAFVHDPVVIASLLGELVGTSRFAEASRLALSYVEHARDDHGTWVRSSMTPALVTNIVLAFAHANERGKLATSFLAFATDLSERANGDYFVDGLSRDLRGSAHAWIALWHLAGGNVDEAARRFRYARDAGYSDIALVRNNSIVHPHLSNPALAEIFAGEQIHEML